MNRLFSEHKMKWICYFILIFLSVDSFSQKTEPFLSDTVHIRVNMTYMVQNGTFHPGTDTVDIAGTMNNWKGEILQRIDTSDIYSITYLLPDNAVYSYKFRIRNGDTIPENVDSMSRFIRVWDTTMIVTNYYNNVNPAVFPMTFNCNMYYQIHAGHFSPATDFLDVAGNFNNDGEQKHEFLFPKSADSMYALTLFFDTAMLATPELKFKFRKNGNWETAELQGDSSRTYTLTGNSDSFTCWYNDIDPNVPSLPFVYNVVILDSIVSKNTVTGAYSYEDYNLKPEGESVYRWYTADSIGGALTEIDSAWYINYTIDSLLIGKYLVFEVKPVTVDSVVGLPVRAWSPEKIIGVGFNEIERPLAKIFPNPVNDVVNIKFLEPIYFIQLMNNRGQVIFSAEVGAKDFVKLDLRQQNNGIFFLRIISDKNRQGVYKIIKQ